MQNHLFQRAVKFREENTRTFTDFEEFRKFFTPKNEEEPEIHGGFARAHFVDTPELSERLKEFKVTVRCIPLEDQPGPGRCLFTGQPTDRIAIFAKSY
jgi:prolyl-tRNA synthetase